MFSLQDCSIHAKIPFHLMHLFTNRLEDGCVYRLYGFEVLVYDSWYRPLKRDCYVKFMRSTSISPSRVQPSLFRRHVFEPMPFNMLGSRLKNDIYLTGLVVVFLLASSCLYIIIFFM